MVWLFGERGYLKDRVLVMVRWLARKGRGLINLRRQLLEVLSRCTMDIMWVTQVLIRLFLLEKIDLFSFPRIMSCLQPSRMMVRGLYQDLKIVVEFRLENFFWPGNRKVTCVRDSIPARVSD